VAALAQLLQMVLLVEAPSVVEGVLHPSVWDILSCMPLSVATNTPDLRVGFSRNGQFLNLISQGGNIGLAVA
jgi:hypothetical protein